MVGNLHDPERSREDLDQLADGLLAAIFGNDNATVRKAHALAAWIRENREHFEDALDSILELYADRERRLEPQEMRAAVTAIGFTDSSLRGDDRLAVLFVLLLERMATLGPAEQRATRVFSTDQVTPADVTFPGGPRA